MNELAFPSIELSIAIPLAAAAIVGAIRDNDKARLLTVLATGLAAILTGGAWLEFALRSGPDALSPAAFTLAGRHVLALDPLNAPLLALTSALYFLTSLTTLRSRVPRFSYGGMLVSESFQLVALGSPLPWGLVAGLVAGMLPPYFELRARGRSTRLYSMHMILCALLLVAGQCLSDAAGPSPGLRPWAVACLGGAVLVRSGVFPFHTWMGDLLENGTYCTSLLFTVPLMGAYAAARLLLPIASDFDLQCLSAITLATSVAGAGLALVQSEVRRFYFCLLVSHSGVVLTGLMSGGLVSMAGALCTWISTSLALGGLGLTLRALESRCGRVSMRSHQGLHEHTPNLAAFFLLTGLASIGFPGTIGFVGLELIIDGLVETAPVVSVALAIAAMLNGVAILRAFFLIFTGTPFPATVSLRVRHRERWAILVLSSVILLGGIFPQWNVRARYAAAGWIREWPAGGGSSVSPRSRRAQEAVSLRPSSFP